jgi:ABC-type multidrug transport system ATPase subunit
MADTPLVEVEQLTVRRGGIAVLREVSLRCDAGLVLVRGRNGAGKTTLLRALAGVAPLAHGSIRIAGHDLSCAPVLARRGLGWMPDGSEPFPYLTARELLEIVAAMRDADPTAAIADYRELAGDPDRRLGASSLGQRRKAVLLAALLGTPQVLLLDEPTNAMDRETVLWLRARLLERRTDAAILVASHGSADLDVSWDRELVVADGSVRG